MGASCSVPLSGGGTVLQPGGQRHRTINEVNEPLVDDPSQVNSAPTEGGWFFKMRLSDPSELQKLLDEAGYNSYTATL